MPRVPTKASAQNGVGFLNFTVTVYWSTFATMTS